MVYYNDIQANFTSYFVIFDIRELFSALQATLIAVLMFACMQGRCGSLIVHAWQVALHNNYLNRLTLYLAFFNNNAQMENGRHSLACDTYLSVKPSHLRGLRFSALKLIGEAFVLLQCTYVCNGANFSLLYQKKVRN